MGNLGAPVMLSLVMSLHVVKIYSQLEELPAFIFAVIRHDLDQVLHRPRVQIITMVCLDNVLKR